METIETRVAEIERDGHDDKLMLTGGVWDQWDLSFCAHGIKLRWICDWCDEHFNPDGDR